MKDKIIIINCNNSTKEEIQNIQTHFFDNGYQWYSSKFNGERKYKQTITDLLIIENNNMFEGNDSIIKDIEQEINIFNNPTEYLRIFKIKKLKTKLK
jgi:hypothetical protein